MSQMDCDDDGGVAEDELLDEDSVMFKGKAMNIYDVTQDMIDEMDDDEEEGYRAAYERKFGEDSAEDTGCKRPLDEKTEASMKRRGKGDDDDEESGDDDDEGSGDDDDEEESGDDDDEEGSGDDDDDQMSDVTSTSPVPVPPQVAKGTGLLARWMREGFGSAPPGVDFELHAYKGIDRWVKEQFAELPGLFFGWTQYIADSGIPEEYLRAIKWREWEKDKRNRQRLRAKDNDSFTEYGFDKLLVSPGPTPFIVPEQDKAHRRLTLAPLATFLVVARYAYKYNKQIEGYDTLNCSGLLCVPAWTRMPESVQHTLENMYKEDYDMHTFVWDDFPEPEPAAGAGVPGVAPSPDDKIVDIGQRVRADDKPVAVTKSSVADAEAEVMGKRPVRNIKPTRKVLEMEETKRAAGWKGPRRKQNVEVETPLAPDKKVRWMSHQVEGLEKGREFEKINAAKPKEERKIAIYQASPGTGKTEMLCQIAVEELAEAMANDTNTAVFGSAPLIEHVENLTKRLLGTEPDSAQYPFVTIAFPNDTPEKAAARVYKLADDGVCSDDELVDMIVEDGVRFVSSTDKSCKVLLKAMDKLQKKGWRVVFMKDEAHANSCPIFEDDEDKSAKKGGSSKKAAKRQRRQNATGEYSASTKLLLEADRGIGFTATPNRALRNLKRGNLSVCEVVWKLSIEEAIRRGVIAAFRVIFADVRDGNDVPADMQPFLGKHAGVGLKALFIVHGMIDQGKRRCIVYAENSRDYLAFKAALPEACRLHGVHCCVEGVHMRQAPKNHPLEHMKCSRTDAAKAKKTFSEGKTLEYRTVGGDSEGSTPRQEERVVLHFMVSMFVFDMCVNVPECDSIFIASPPKTPNEQSAILALQRAGRAWRKRDGKHFAAIFVFAEASSQFADALLDRLFDDDDRPGRLERARQRIKKVVRSLGANSDEVAEPARVEAEKASIKLLHERFKFHPSGSGFDALKKHRENQSTAIVDGMREVVHDDETTYVTRSQMPVDTADDELKAGALWGRVKKGIADQKDKATRELGVRAKEIWEELDGRGWGWIKEEFYAFADAHFKNKTTGDARLAGMRLDAAPTPRQICACFPRMLLGLNYPKPRPCDDGKAVEACCASWIKYRNAQRAKSPARATPSTPTRPRASGASGSPGRTR